MFCAYCGKEIQPNHKFCAYCGKGVRTGGPEIVHQMPNPIVTQPIYQEPELTDTRQTAPDVVWVLRTNRKLSLMKIVSCHVVFMRDRLILAHLSPELQKFETARAQQNVRDNGLGFFKGSASMLHFWAEFYKRCAGEILAEDPTNMIIDYSMVTEVYFKCYSSSTNFDDNYDNVNQGKLHLSTTGGETIKLTHTETDNKSVKELLTGLFGYRLKYKR